MNRGLHIFRMLLNNQRSVQVLVRPPTPQPVKCPLIKSAVQDTAMHRSGQIRFHCEIAFEFSPKQRRKIVTFTALLCPLSSSSAWDFLSNRDFSPCQALRTISGNATQQEMTVLQNFGMVNIQTAEEVASCKNQKEFWFMSQGLCLVSLGVSLMVVTVLSDTSWSHLSVLGIPVKPTQFCAKTYDKQHLVHLLLGNALVSGSKHFSTWIAV